METVSTIAAYLVFAFAGFALVVFGIAEWYLFVRPEWRARATSRLIPKPSPVMAVVVTLLGLTILGILVFSLVAKGGLTMWTKHAVDGFVRSGRIAVAISFGLAAFIMATLAIVVTACSHGTPRARVPAVQALALPAAPVASPGPTWDDAACLDLMESRDGWRFAGAFLSGIGGAGAISTAATGQEVSDKWAAWGVGIAAGVSGAAGAAAVLIAASKAEDFEKYCTVEPDPLAGLGLPTPGTNPRAGAETKTEPETADAGSEERHMEITVKVYEEKPKLDRNAPVVPSDPVDEFVFSAEGKAGNVTAVKELASKELTSRGYKIRSVNMAGYTSVIATVTPTGRPKVEVHKKPTHRVGPHGGPLGRDAKKLMKR